MSGGSQQLQCTEYGELNASCSRTMEPPHGKTNNLHMRKQRRRSASRLHREADQRLCFRYTDSTIPLLLKSEISSF